MCIIKNKDLEVKTRNSIYDTEMEKLVYFILRFLTKEENLERKF